MKFSAALRGVAYSDPKEFAAAVKAAPPLEPFNRGGKPVVVPTVEIPAARAKVFVKPRVTLTAKEREWLGATVRRADGAVGQVWAMHPQPGYVWVVANGYPWFQIHTDALEKLQDGKLAEVEIARLDVPGE
jgi:hypothetical protein